MIVRVSIRLSCRASTSATSSDCFASRLDWRHGPKKRKSYLPQDPRQLDGVAGGRSCHRSSPVTYAAGRLIARAGVNMSETKQCRSPCARAFGNELVQHWLQRACSTLTFRHLPVRPSELPMMPLCCSWNASRAVAGRWPSVTACSVSATSGLNFCCNLAAPLPLACEENHQHQHSIRGCAKEGYWTHHSASWHNEQDSPPKHRYSALTLQTSALR